MTQTQAPVMVGPGRHSAARSIHVYIVVNLSRTIVTAGSWTGMRPHSPLKNLPAIRPMPDEYQILYVIDILDR